MDVTNFVKKVKELRLFQKNYDAGLRKGTMTSAIRTQTLERKKALEEEVDKMIEDLFKPKPKEPPQRQLEL